MSPFFATDSIVYSIGVVCGAMVKQKVRKTTLSLEYAIFMFSIKQILTYRKLMKGELETARGF